MPARHDLMEDQRIPGMDEFVREYDEKHGSADLLEAAKSGDTRATLEALRDKLAYRIQRCDSGRDVAALSKRLLEVMIELDQLPKPQTEDSPLARARHGS